MIQWNCRGLRARREEVELLLHKFSPSVLCLQETKLKASNHPYQTFSNYVCYYSSTENGSGGVGVIVKNTTLHRQIYIKTDLQAVAISATIDKKAYTVCSVYIPPTSKLDLNELEDLKNQLPSPFILMGDFNAHNPMWRSQYTTPKGKILEQFIVEQDLILMNNKFYTHYDDYHKSSSLIDLTICQPSVYLDFDCKVFESSHGSDHYPVQIILNDADPPEDKYFRRWNFRKANWNQFKSMCKTCITDDLFIVDSEDMSMYDNDKMRVFTENLLNIASECIPVTSTNPKKKPKPWFDDDCKKIIKQRNAAQNKAINKPSDQNKQLSQILRAKCRRTLKQKKRASWRQYVSSINNKTPIKRVWDKIRKITRKHKSKLLHHIQNDKGEIVADKK